MMDNLPRMRTLPELAAEIAEQDPKTKLTLPVLRRMVKTGKIPAVYSGKRALVDASRLGEYLADSTPIKQPDIRGVIRKVGA